MGRLHRHDVGVELPRRVKHELDGVREVSTSILIASICGKHDRCDFPVKSHENSSVPQTGHAARTKDCPSMVS